MNIKVGIFLIALLGVSFASSATVQAAQVDSACTDIDVIFARGSGQKIDADETSRFEEKIKERIGTVSRTNYRLGSESYGGHKYPAVDVGNVFNGNALGASASAGYANDYGKSVDAGVGELYNYVVQRNAKCPNARIILGGYSQGAQVVGQTLPKFSSAVQSKIDFSALFGDPKLYLPEGEGVYPDACRGKNFSSWRRVIGSCHTDNGSLGARKPYLPTAAATKTGLWCNEVDFVCGTSKYLTDQAGHAKYKDVGGAIDKAAIEIASRLKKTLPVDRGSGIDDSTKLPGTGTTGLDVAFVLDTTGSMGGQIEQTKAFIRNYAQKIKDLRGRVALTVYKDSGDVYTAQILSNLQDTPDDMLSKLDTVYASGGGDWEEAGNHALMTTFNGLNWKNGATKAAILLTDAPSHNPDVVDGSTFQTVAKRSLEIDPVNVYPVVGNDVSSHYEELARLTTGQVIVDTGETEVALTQALTKIEERPVVLLKNTEYAAQPGQEITFDASDSYVIDATITKYDWDFNGDGTFDRTTTTPVTNYTYSAKFDGTMQVRLTASNSTIANASAVVKVGTYVPPVTPKAPTNVAATVVSTKNSVSTVKLSWKPADSLAASWAIAVNGVVIGTVDKSRTSIELTDIDRVKDNEFSVAGVLADKTVGDSASVIVAMQTSTSGGGSSFNLLAFLLECVRRLLTGWGLAVNW